MIKSHIPRILLKFGILGVFIYGAVVAAGSFALFGCICTDWMVRPSSSESKPVPKPDPAPIAPAEETKQSTL